VWYAYCTTKVCIEGTHRIVKSRVYTCVCTTKRYHGRRGRDVDTLHILYYILSIFYIYNIYIYTNTMGHLELEKDIYITPCVTCTRVMCNGIIIFYFMFFSIVFFSSFLLLFVVVLLRTV